MLTAEQRQFVLDTLKVQGSDTVLLNALDESTRELAHATTMLANAQNSRAIKKAIAAPVLSVVVTPDVTKPIQKTFPVFHCSPLPQKLGATGQACIAALKRNPQSMSLVQLSKTVGVSVAKTSPQIALAMHRGLIIQTGECEFTVPKQTEEKT